MSQFSDVDWFFPKVNNPIGVGEAIIPEVSMFLKENNILTTEEIIKHCNGTLKTGIKFKNFNREGESFIFPFDDVKSFEHIFKYDKVPQDILNNPNVSVHWRAHELLNYLDTKVPENVTIYRNEVTYDDVKDYDLVIDSTGFKRAIAKWDDEFVTTPIPNNAALTYRQKYTNKDEQCKPYSTFVGMKYGWMWNVPLGDQLAIGYVHDNKYDVKDEFINYIEEVFSNKPDENDINLVNMKTGRMTTHLKDNVVTIGLSSAFIEPIESTGIYFTTTALEKIKLYLDGEITAEDYNNHINETFDNTVNFILAHYKYSKNDNPYWNYYKTLEVQDYKPMDLFPSFAWDSILAGFRDDVKQILEHDLHQMIDVLRGKLYKEWLEDARNA